MVLCWVCFDASRFALDSQTVLVEQVGLDPIVEAIVEEYLLLAMLGHLFHLLPHLILFSFFQPLRKLSTIFILGIRFFVLFAKRHFDHALVDWLSTLHPAHPYINHLISQLKQGVIATKKQSLILEHGPEYRHHHGQETDNLPAQMKQERPPHLQTDLAC